MDQSAGAKTLASRPRATQAAWMKNYVLNETQLGTSDATCRFSAKYVLQHAKTIDLNLKLTKNVYKKYKKLQSTIYKNYDTSSLVKSIID